MTIFPDPRETRAPADREAELFARLGKHIAHAQSATTTFAASLAALTQLPVLV